LKEWYDAIASAGDVGKLEEIRIAVFGKNTYQAALDRNLRVDIKVPSPGNRSMTEALEKYIKVANKRIR